MPVSFGVLEGLDYCRLAGLLDERPLIRSTTLYRAFKAPNNGPEAGDV